MGRMSISKGSGSSKMPNIETKTELVYVDREVLVTVIKEVEKIVEMRVEVPVIQEVIKYVEREVKVPVYVDKPTLFEIIKEVEKLVEVRIPVITRVTPLWAKLLLALVAIEILGAILAFSL